MTETITAYFGMTCYPVLLIILLIYLGRGFRCERKLNILCAVILLGILFPVLYAGCKAIGQGAETYRFFWLVPLSIVAAYLAVEICRKMDFDRLVIGVAAGVMIVVLGSVLFNRSTWKLPQNVYALDKEIVSVAQIIRQDCKDRNVKVIGEPQVLIQLRQYDGNLCWAYTGRGQMVAAEQDEIQDEMRDDPQYRLAMAIQNNNLINEDMLKTDLESLDVDYMVLPDTCEMMQYLPDDFMQLIDQTDHYDIYKRN